MSVSILIIIKMQETRKVPIDWARAPPITQILNSSSNTVLRRCHIVLAINENHILCLNF